MDTNLQLTHVSSDSDTSNCLVLSNENFKDLGIMETFPYKLYPRYLLSVVWSQFVGSDLRSKKCHFRFMVIFVCVWVMDHLFKSQYSLDRYISGEVWVCEDF